MGLKLSISHLTSLQTLTWDRMHGLLAEYHGCITTCGTTGRSIPRWTLNYVLGGKTQVSTSWLLHGIDLDPVRKCETKRTVYIFAPKK